MWMMWTLILVLAVIAIAAMFWGYTKARSAAHLKYELTVTKIVTENLESLHTLWKQTVYQNEHGHYKYEKWFEAVDSFIDRVMCTDKTIRLEFYLNPTSRHLIKYQIIPDAVAAYNEQETGHASAAMEQQQQADKPEVAEKRSASTFEEHCANLLQEAGWNARVASAAMAEKGINVIATLNGGKLILRCQVSDKPVGDYVVQEIISGRQNEDTDFAGVVSNQPYTPAAKQQANSSKILLLNPKELAGLGSKLGLA